MNMLTKLALTCLTVFALSNTASAAAPVKDDPHAGLTQAWDKNLPSASRFTVLTDFGGAAVRDNNTGLVWEQAPDATTRTWVQSIIYCVNKNVGGTRGWRLPSVAELASLINPTLAQPFVPASVFTGVQLEFYWSATKAADAPLPSAWFVDFFGGTAFEHDKNFSGHAWCVRGGMNADQDWVIGVI